MTTGKYGWFRYGPRHPEGKVGQWTITRTPQDPPIVAWKVDENAWIIDDDPGDQHVQVDGFTEAELRVALEFARTMGWTSADARYDVREMPS
jgi:hypothetical protein